MTDYNKIHFNTALGEDLFRNEFLNTIILHIPHSSTFIPKENLATYLDDKILQEQIELFTDHASEKIFDFDGLTKVVFPYSRVFCDVERLPDEQEEMYSCGRGFYYTKTDCGKTLRSEKDKNQVQKIYEEYHQNLTNLVQEKLQQENLALIIDCHTFPNEPFKSDLNQNTNRPDFCIGVDAYHTPDYLVKRIRYNLTKLGYTVKINEPYSGTLVPLNFYQKNKKIESIMIEINRKLYMQDSKIVNDKVKLLQDLLQNILF